MFQGRFKADELVREMGMTSQEITRIQRNKILCDILLGDDLPEETSIFEKTINTIKIWTQRLGSKL